MADLRIVDAPVLLQESITDDVKMPTGGLGNYAIRLGDLVWYVVAKENLASKSYVDNSSKGVQGKLDTHVSAKDNPHQVTKAQVGLGNVDNTADIDKPVSNAVNSAIITATTDMATKTYVNQKNNLKADKATTYTKDETYSKNEVNSRDGDLTTLVTVDKTNLVKSINEVYDTTKGVVALYNKNVELDASANGWTDKLIKTSENVNQRQINDGLDSIAQLSAITNPRNGQRVVVKSYHTPNYALLNPFKGGGTFIYDSAKVNVNDGGVCINGWVRQTKLENVEDVWFGAEGDGVADDTVALQKAIDYCNDTSLFARAPALEITGKSLITSSLMIDRPTDSTTAVFEIYGKSRQCGIYINKGMSIFDSRLSNATTVPPYPLAPSSEFVRFNNLTFEANQPHPDAFVMTEKFLRIEFNTCRFINVRGVIAQEYLQSIKFYNCKHRGHYDYFIVAKDGYDIRCIHPEFESAGRGFKFTGLLRSGNFDYALFQNSQSPFVNIYGGVSVSVDKNYFEHNTDVEIMVGSDVGDVSTSIMINNNIFLLREELSNDGTFYPIKLGYSRNVTLIANSSTGNLCNNGFASSFEVFEIGNSVKDGGRVLKNDITRAKEITVTATQDQLSATPIFNRINIINTSPAADAAVLLPKLTNAPSIIKIVNNSSNDVKVYPNANERFSGVVYNAAFVLAPNSSKDFASTTSDYWNLI